MGAIVGGEPPVDIERFGAIQADLAAGVPRDDVLAMARLTEAQLVAITEHWLGAMTGEVRRGRTVLSQRYARAYIARRPELLRDPEEDVDRLAALAPARSRPVASTAPTDDAQPASAAAAPSDATPRFVPSYLLEDAARSQRAPVQVVETAALPPSAQVPPSSGLPPLAPRARAPMPLLETAPLPCNAPVAPPPPFAAKPINKLKGTMMAMDIPASFKALPFASDGTPPPSSRAAPLSQRAPLVQGAPLSQRAPQSQAAPPSIAALVSPPSTAVAVSAPARPAITGTAAFELPEHLRNIPLSGPPKGPPPPPAPPGPPPPGAPAGASPPAGAPSLPSLEEYVRVGVDLGATTPDRVDAVLAQARWTRATWAAVDQAYRARLARDPALQSAFQAALTAERVRRAPHRR